MTYQEYHDALRSLDKQRERARRLSSDSPELEKVVAKLFELALAVKGHAWCMDVKSERRKAGRLFASEVSDLLAVWR